MEGLRGYAVFLVFLVHYGALVEPWLAPGGWWDGVFKWLTPIGHTGVDLFFVLSGYLIYGSLIAKAQAFRSYARRRLQRIYPAFFAIFSLYLLLSLAMPSRSKLPANAFDAATYVIANLLLLPGFFPIEPLVTVAWSLSYEVFYYLITPLVIATFALRQRSPGFRMAFFALTAAGLLVYSALYGGHVRLVMFIAGVLLWEGLHLPGPSTIATARWLVPLALMTSMAGAVIPIQFDLPPSMGYTLRTLVVAVGYSVLCLASFSSPPRGLGRLFTWTPLRWLGNASYSYYLIHGLTLNAIFTVIAMWSHPGASALLVVSMLVPAFIATCAPALLLYLVVERRFSLEPSTRAVTT